jgi:hypothetical protein
MSLLNVLKTLDSKINGYLGLNWQEGMPAEPTAQSKTVDYRMEQERELLREQRQAEMRKEMEEKVELKDCDINNLTPGHYYLFNVGAVTWCMYFICALRFNNLVFSSSTPAQIQRYSVDGHYNLNNPETRIVSKNAISNTIKAVIGRDEVDVGSLSAWIKQSNL